MSSCHESGTKEIIFDKVNQNDTSQILDKFVSYLSEKVKVDSIHFKHGLILLDSLYFDSILKTKYKDAVFNFSQLSSRLFQYWGQTKERFYYCFHIKYLIRKNDSIYELGFEKSEIGLFDSIGFRGPVPPSECRFLLGGGGYFELLEISLHQNNTLVELKQHIRN